MVGGRLRGARCTTPEPDPGNAGVGRISRSMRRFGAAKAAWRWKEPNRLTEGVQGV